MSEDSRESTGPALNPKERPTLKTISQLTGLAIPTVSRALSDAPDIGQRTKDKVRQVATQIGYRPNRAGLRLRTGKTQVISLVLSTEHDVTNQTAQLIGSIAAGLRDTQYHLIATPFFPDQDPMEPIRYIVESGSADGIILNQTLPKDPRIEYLQELGFPFATHGRSVFAKPHNYYDFDHREFGSLSLNTLCERGRKSVVLIAARQQYSYAQDLVLGAHDVGDKHGMTVRLLENVHASDSMGAIEAALNEHFEQYPETDAVLSTAFTGAMAAISVFDDKRMVIGKEADLIVREFIPMLQRFRPGTLSVTENVELAGDFLASAILHAIDFPQAAPRQFLEVPILTPPADEPN